MVLFPLTRMAAWTPDLKSYRLQSCLRKESDKIITVLREASDACTIASATYWTDGRSRW